MSDLERLLRRSLASAGDAYSPDDFAAARERFLRRRRRRNVVVAASTVVATGAIVVAAIFVAPRLGEGAPSVEIAEGVQALEVRATVAVGDRPSGIAVAGASVWVANHDAGTVSRIDAATDQVIATIKVGGRPDDVAVAGGSVWVANPDKMIIEEIDPAANRPTGRLVDVGSTDHIDLAGDDKALWVAGGAFERHRQGHVLVNPVPPVFEGSAATDRPTDVAAGDAGVWAWNANTGDLRAVAGGASDVLCSPGVECSEEMFRKPHDVGTSTHGDLAVGGGKVWVAIGDEGRVLQFDPGSGEITSSAYVGGPYIGLEYGNDYVWAVSYGEDETSAMSRIDPVSGELVDRATLSGRAVDVAVGAGAVWLSDSSDDSIDRIEMVRERAEERTRDSL